MVTEPYKATSSHVILSITPNDTSNLIQRDLPRRMIMYLQRIHSVHLRKPRSLSISETRGIAPQDVHALLDRKGGVGACGDPEADVELLEG